MHYLFILLLIAHFTFDFYLQTDKMVENKKFQNWRNKSFYYYHAWHATLHYFGFIIATVVFFYTIHKDLSHFPRCDILKLGLAIQITHFAIDITKEFLNSKYPKNDMRWFVCDQFFHVAILFASVIYLNKYCGVIVSTKEILKVTVLVQMSLLILGIIFLIKPTSIFVMKFLDMAMCNGKVKHISVTKSHVAKMFDEALSKEVVGFVATDNLVQNDVDKKVTLYITNANIITGALESKKDDLSVDVENVFTTNNGGKWIGYVERVMIFTLFLLGQFTAIAAVMAIKTAFRFNDLKDDNDSQRSEYIMLGTFSSLFVTIIIAVLVKHFIKVQHFPALISGFRALFS